jgi:GNAT superfamily N-acetyltransferase
MATFVAEAARDWIAVADGIHAEPEVVEVAGLWVDSDWRGMGIARALVGEVASWATHAGAGRLALWVREDNGRARDLFAGTGFSVSGSAPLVSDPTRRQLRLVRELR